MNKKMWLWTIGLVISLAILVFAFLGVYSNSKEKTLKEIQDPVMSTFDQYRLGEDIEAWYGRVTLTNAEEFGTNKNKVSGIIHYQNTTPYEIEISPSMLGAFMDKDYEYTLYGVNDVAKKYLPGEEDTFKVFIKREEGLTGLGYVTKGDYSMAATERISLYRGCFDLSTELPEDEKIERYHISSEYKEEVKDTDLVKAVDNDELINIKERLLSDETDEGRKEAEEKRREREEARQKAVNQVKAGQ